MIVSLIMLLQEVTEQAAPPAEELTIFALLFMLASMGAVTLLAGWSFARVLRGKRHFDPDGTGPAKPPVPGEAEGKPSR
jgi:hypothetical protein